MVTSLLPFFISTTVFLIVVFATFVFLNRKGYGDSYSLVLFALLLGSWLLPIIISKGFIVRWYTPDQWLLILCLYYVFKFAVRFFLRWLSINGLSYRYNIMLSLILYVCLLVPSVAHPDRITLLISFLASVFLTSRFGINVSYWSNQTTRWPSYITSTILYTIPLIGAISNTLPFHFSYSPPPPPSVTSYSLAVLGCIIVLLVFGFVYLPEKTTRKRDMNLNNIVNSEGLSTPRRYYHYPIMFFLVFVGYSTITHTSSYEALYQISNGWGSALLAVMFACFLGTAIFTGTKLIKILNDQIIKNIGCALIVFPTTLVLIFFYVQPNLAWYYWIICLTPALMGLSLIVTTLLADMVHLTFLKKLVFFSALCLGSQSLGYAVGYLSAFLLQFYLDDDLASVLLLLFGIGSITAFFFVYHKNRAVTLKVRAQALKTRKT